MERHAAADLLECQMYGQSVGAQYYRPRDWLGLEEWVEGSVAYNRCMQLKALRRGY
jgi:hypothetical protein